MTSRTKHIFIALGIGLAVLIVYEMYKAYKAGTTAISDILMAPWNALKSVWNGVSGAASSAAGAVSSAASTVANNYSWASQLPALTQQEVANAQAQGTIAASYQPGGANYNMILATQGQAAADAAAATTAQHAANEQAQANADASSWTTTLFSL